jgi:hypothetical protein
MATASEAFVLIGREIRPSHVARWPVLWPWSRAGLVARLGDHKLDKIKVPNWPMLLIWSSRMPGFVCMRQVRWSLLAKYKESASPDKAVI